MKNSNFLSLFSIALVVSAFIAAYLDHNMLAVGCGLVSLPVGLAGIICDTIEEYSGIREMIENQDKLNNNLMKVNLNGPHEVRQRDGGGWDRIMACKGCGLFKIETKECVFCDGKGVRKENPFAIDKLKTVIENQCFTCHRMFKSTSASIECAKCMANKTDK
jgi:hypothetical protein